MDGRCDMQNYRLQFPPIGPFTSENLLWDESDEAVIPFDRFTDFIAGEESRPESMCSFKISTRGMCNRNNGRVTTRYWCAYGPGDKRQEAAREVPSRKPGAKGPGSRPLASKTTMGTSNARGCQCHFALVHTTGAMDCTIRWAQRDHIDKNGLFCHGTRDPTTAFGSALVSPYFSKSCKEFVERMLRAGFDALDIVVKHRDKIRQHLDERPHEALLWSKDMGLTHKHVINVKASLNAQKLDFTTDDARSVSTWVMECRSKPECDKSKCEILLYQQQRQATQDDGSDKVPFMLVFGSTWMLTQMAILGNGNAISMDSTFATNMYEFPLYTVLSFDKFQNGIPCCWAILERHCAEDLILVLGAIRKRVNELHEELGLPGQWAPSCFLVDDADAEHIAMRSNFPDTPINLCLWHVRRCWLRNLISKVSDPIARASMNRDLGTIMYTWNKDYVGMSNAFMRTWADQKAFITYYRKDWHSRIQWWVVQCRMYNHSNQNTNGAIERWHFIMKAYLKTSKKSKRSRKLMWLLLMLVETIEPVYYFALQLKSQGLLRNKIVEAYVMQSLEKCKDIPDSFVTRGVLDDGTKFATVQSATIMSTSYDVLDYDRVTASCSCGDSVQGNTCKHQLKCLLMDGHSEMFLKNFLGTYSGTIHGGIEHLYQASMQETGMENSAPVTVPISENVDLQDLQEDSQGDATMTGVELDQDSEEQDFSIDSNPQPEKEIQLEDLDNITHSIWKDVKGSQTAVNRFAMKLKALGNDMRNFLVEEMLMTQGNNGDNILEDFQPVPNADMSMKRKPDFIERMHGGPHRRKGNAELVKLKKIAAEELADIQPFVKNKVDKPSIQTLLDREALKAFDLNEEPIQLPEKAPRKSRKGEKKSTSKKKTTSAKKTTNAKKTTSAKKTTNIPSQASNYIGVQCSQASNYIGVQCSQASVECLTSDRIMGRSYLR